MSEQTNGLTTRNIDKDRHMTILDASSLPQFPVEHTPIVEGQLLTPFLRKRGFTEEELRDLFDGLGLSHSVGNVQSFTNICLDYDKIPQRDLPKMTSYRIAGVRGSERRGVLVSAADIEPERTTWLWTHHIPSGEITLLAGNEGLGKSTIGFSLIARITTGAMEGEHKGTPKRVVICATEDSIKKTILPRLMAAGADRARVHFFTIQAGGVDESPSFPDDLPYLQEVMEDPDVALIYFDPLTSRVDGKIDTHKDAETRRALEPLAIMAHETGTAILGIIHRSKASSTNLLNTVMGSKAFTAVSRAVLACTESDDDDGTRLFGLVKSNLGPDDLPAMRYRIIPAVLPIADNVEVSRVEWLGSTEMSVKRHHAEMNKPERVSQREEIAEWIRTFLADGAKPSKEMNDAAAEHGFRERTYKDVRTSMKLGTDKKGDGGTWRVWLPAEPS